MTEIEHILSESIGEVSALFMSQKKLGTKIVMPTERLLKIIKKTEKEIDININNILWQIGADIMRMGGVKNIKTTYKRYK